jgi:hypothetical protein
VSFSAGGKLQFNGYREDDYDADTFDVAAILAGVGLDGLLLDATTSCSHPSFQASGVKRTHSGHPRPAGQRQAASRCKL